MLYFIDDVQVAEWDIHPFSNSHLIFYIEEKGENALAQRVLGQNGEVLGLIWMGFINEEDGERQMSKKIE